MSTEPVTVVLSAKGWARAAKGHDLDPAHLQYKAGDRIQVRGEGAQQSERHLHRLHRAHLFSGLAHAALGAWAGRAAHGQAQSAAGRTVPWGC
jgi:hypothetical protein